MKILVLGYCFNKSTGSELVDYSLSRRLSHTMVAEYKQTNTKEVFKKHLKECCDGMLEKKE